jgi:hypothetical protein
VKPWNPTGWDEAAGADSQTAAQPDLVIPRAVRRGRLGGSPLEEEIDEPVETNGRDGGDSGDQDRAAARDRVSAVAAVAIQAGKLEGEMTMGRRRCSVGDGARREGWRRSRNAALRCQHPANYASALGPMGSKFQDLQPKSGKPRQRNHNG